MTGEQPRDEVGRKGNPHREGKVPSESPVHRFRHTTGMA